MITQLIGNILNLVATSTFLVDRAESKKLKNINRKIYEHTNCDEKCTVGFVFDKHTLMEIKEKTFKKFQEYEPTALYGEFLFFVVKKFKDFIQKRMFIGGLINVSNKKADIKRENSEALYAKLQLSGGGEIQSSE